MSVSSKADWHPSLLKATRGNIHVRHRDQLEEIAGGCYGLPEKEYARLIGTPAAGTPEEKLG